ncbi:MSCRAMM family adhesin SdrC [Natrinema sp. S1CR25-10]|uniref:MSCRAMM family adhesin SdrC n=2 Tax=Natrinema salsiterrestre TaxID=2950540 RepID=A0A9Q4KWC2_9EURY|nr:PGF-CTERM sorting domain-containing protein [Natrinema salsiterrestre]MDF9743963.1 MSCRAMM family adhesin SdrC [Natrinema salsiterrestre]
MRQYSAVLMGAVVLVSAMLAGTAGAAGATDASAAIAQDDQAAVTFDAQTSGGSTIVVDEVTLPEGGFVTIHDSSLGDGETLGSVVGSSAYLEAGTHENITVDLEKPISEDDTLFAMAHTDSDDDRVYSFVSSNGEADGPYTVDGDIVMADAEVTVSADLEMTEQPTTGDSVVVDRVELAGGGFVTVHDSSIADGAVFESIRGTSEYLEAGVHENVRVSLDEPLEGDETVYPMAHRDSNGNEAYDFATSEGADDGPYANANGDPVMAPTDVTVSDDATVSFENQSSGGSSVVVDEVFVPEGGFVTMHDSSIADGAVFESIRGTSEYLEAGLHRDVVIRLDDELEEDDALFGMAHRDTNDNNKYDFPASEGEEDGPYTTDGDIVMDDGDVTVSAAVSASAQSSDGTTMTIDRVDLSEGGFVTVHDASLFEGDVFGSVVGTSEYLEAGTHEDVEITFDERLTGSQTVVPMAHQDTNDNEAYDFAASEGEDDGPYTANGDAVVDTAKLTVPATVDAMDQEGGETITVESVTLHDGGFVTVHDSTLADGAVFDSVRGTSAYLGPGTHEDVEITLDDPLTSDDDVFAMAHQDTDADETYDFLESEGSSDGPYAAAGGPIMASASVTVEGDETDSTDDGDSMDGEDGSNEMNEQDDDSETDEESGDSVPGFGITAALVALLAAAAIARRVD